KQMKNGILTLLLIGALAACHSQREITEQQVTSVVAVPVGTPVPDTIAAEPVKKEAVVRTHGNELMHYCVIVGSFMYEQNALNLRNSLMCQGFSNTSVMRNQQGMYRVSAGCDDSWQTAWNEVCRIRRHYPQFQDAWVLEEKEE
ncbi:MAG: SPOR domain-containing protein, partial [Odoribacter sp.]|nr:SPOR domain-containing protein [Odoribacter sp.]